jgi:hypothetical protein
VIVIDHREVSCVVAGKFPRFEARFDPADTVARAQLHFKPEGWPHWYSVPMKQEGASFLGVLPKPDKKLEKLGYYISVVDRSFAESRTPEYAPIVVSGPGGCQQNKVLALALKKAAQVIVSGPEGIAHAPLVPVGFSTDGVVAGAAGAPASAAASANASAGAGAATAGHGVSATLLVVGGVAVIGGGVAIAGAAHGGGGGSGGGGGGGPTTTQPPGVSSTTLPGTSPPSTTTPGGAPAIYHVAFVPNIDVSVCAGRPLTWCCQSVIPDANGNFNEIWAPTQPNTARVSGHVDATTFSATLACVSGSASTPLNASGSGGTYRGSFNFNGSRGTLTITVTKGP